MTVFDPSTLHQLVDDPQARPFARDLACTFRRMLQPRVTRLVEAVLTDDVDGAMDAVLSLKVSSTMTGARELAEMASFIEHHLRHHDLPSARSLALLLPAAAARAEQAIATYVDRAEPA